MISIIILAVSLAVIVHGICKFDPQKPRSQYLLPIVCVIVFFITFIGVAGFMNALVLLFGVVVAILLYISNKSKAIWCKPAAAFSCSLGLLLALINFFVQGNRADESIVNVQEKEIDREIKATGYSVGQYVRRYARSEILLLTSSFVQEDYVNKLINGLKAGLDSPSIKISKEEIKVQMEPKTPFVVKAENQQELMIRRLIEHHPASDVVVSLIPIKNEVFEYFWEKLGEGAKFKPKIVFINVEVKNIELMFKAEVVLAAVFSNPGPRIYEASKKVEDDLDIIFQKNNILVNAENFASYKSKYPVLFP